MSGQQLIWLSILLIPTDETNGAVADERSPDVGACARADRPVPAVGRHGCDVAKNNVGPSVRTRQKERLALQLKHSTFYCQRLCRNLPRTAHADLVVLGPQLTILALLDARSLG